MCAWLSGLGLQDVYYFSELRVVGAGRFELTLAFVGLSDDAAYGFCL